MIIETMILLLIVGVCLCGATLFLDWHYGKITCQSNGYDRYDFGSSDTINGVRYCMCCRSNINENQTEFVEDCKIFREMGK